MDKRTIRAFATGLLLSSIFLMAYQYFFNSDEITTIKKGYKTVKVSELNKLQSEAVEWKNKYNQLQKTKSKSEKLENPKQTIVKYHLSITSGMTPDKIGERLKTGGIVKDSQKFVQYLIDHHYQNKIQIGEYDLSNNMSFDEIARVITKDK